MTRDAYHHGNLRAVLLAEAERTVRDQGVAGLTLRDLARRAGVSHTAPRRHFPDRQSLLDALAASGFSRLADEVQVAIDDAGTDYVTGLRSVANVYVRFATRDAALLELMFAGKVGGAETSLPDGAQRVLAAFGDFLRRGQTAGVFPAGNPERLRLLVVATFQGIATLAASGRIGPDGPDPVVADAVALFTTAPA